MRESRYHLMLVPQNRSSDLLVFLGHCQPALDFMGWLPGPELISIPPTLTPLQQDSNLNLNMFEEDYNQSVNHCMARNVNSLHRMPEALFIFLFSFEQVLSHANCHKVCCFCCAGSSRYQKGGSIEDELTKSNRVSTRLILENVVHETVQVQLALFVFAHYQHSLKLLP